MSSGEVFLWREMSLRNRYCYECGVAGVDIGDEEEEEEEEEWGVGSGEYLISGLMSVEMNI